MKVEYRVTLASTVLGLLFWVVDAALDAFLLKRAFLDLLFWAVPVDEWGERLLVLVCFFVLGLLIPRLLVRRDEAVGVLQEEGDRAQKYLDVAGVMFVLIDAEQKVVRVNKKGCEILGYREKEIVGKDWFDTFVPEERRDEIRAVFSRLMAGEIESLEWVEAPVLTKSGEERIISWHNTTLTDEDGKIIGTLSSGEDITQRKRAEEALRRSEYQYRTTIDSFSDAMHVVDRELRIILTNSTMEQWVRELDLSTDMIGRTVYEVFPFLHDKVRDEYQHVFETGEVMITEESTKVGDTEIVTETRKIPVFEEQEVVRVITAVRDISDRKRAESALRESEARYRSLFENSPNSLWEEDFSAVKAFIDDLHASGVSDIRGHFEKHPQAVMHCAALVKIINVNQATLDLLGAGSKEELLGGLDKFFLGETLSVFREELVTLAEGKTWFESEIVGQPLSGGPVQCWTGVSIAPGYEETWSKVFVSVLDITERARVREVLRESETRYQSLFEDSPISLWEEDFSGVKTYFDDLRDAGTTDLRAYFKEHPEKVAHCASLVEVLDVNQAALDLFGAETKTELLGNLDKFFVVDESLDVFREEMLALAEGQTRFESEITAFPLEGDPVHTLIRLSIAPGYEETWEKIFVSAIDITERRQAEETLHQRQRELESLLETSRDLSGTLDWNELLALIVRRAVSMLEADECTLFQLEEDGNTLRPVLILGDHADVAASVTVQVGQGITGHSVFHRRPILANDAQHDPRAFHVPGTIDEEREHLMVAPLLVRDKPTGAMLVRRISRNPFTEENLELFVGFAAQATIAVENARLYERVQRHADELERRVAERTAELEAVNAHLQALSRFKDEFISNVSHELRTPIASLKLYHHLLTARPDKQVVYLTTLKRETERLECIVEDLLYLSRMDQGQVELALQPVDLNALIDSHVVDRLPLARTRGLTLTFTGEADLPELHADLKLLERVLSILLSNALNYVSPGGHVTVSTRAAQSGGKDWVQFSVSDTGPGIAVEEQAMVFERFTRGIAGRVSGTPGTGLGLSIAREIVDHHQGRIEVFSEGVSGKGATFTVWLPVQPPGGAAQ